MTGAGVGSTGARVGVCVGRFEGDAEAVAVGDAEAVMVGDADWTTGASVGGRVGVFGTTGAPEGAPDGAPEGDSDSSVGGGASTGALVGTVGVDPGALVKPPPVNFGEQSQTPPRAGSTTSSKVSIPSSEWVNRWQCTAIRPKKLFASYRIRAMFDDRIMIVSW